MKKLFAFCTVFIFAVGVIVTSATLSTANIDGVAIAEQTENKETQQVDEHEHSYDNLNPDQNENQDANTEDTSDQGSEESTDESGELSEDYGW